MRGLCFFFALHAVTALTPDVAEACAPPSPGLHSFPADGGTHPANAAILLDGYGADPELLTVTVDGQAARLVRAFEIKDDAWWIEPPPSPGDQVKLEGIPCPGGDCGPFAVEFTASEPDRTPPLAPTGAWFGIYDHVDTTEGRGDCSEHGSTTVFTHLADGWRDDGGSRVLVRVAVYDARDSEPVDAFGVSRRADRVTLWSDGLKREDAEHYCLRIRVTDLAGNAAPVVDACTPCGFKTDPEGLDEWTYGGQEPEWSGADLVGGPCDLATPTPADEDLDREGTAQDEGCAVAPGGSGGPWARGAPPTMGRTG